MTERTFYEPRKLSPTGLTVVIAMHAAALGALAFMKGPEFVRPLFGETKVTFIPLPTDPPENPPPPRDEPRPVQRPTFIDNPRPPIQLPTYHPPVQAGDSEPVFTRDPPGPQVIEPRVEPPSPPPVRIEAEFDPRYAGDMQPPYPPSEERAGREGSVRLRLTIGSDGRVKAVQRLSATSDAFWSATQRHAVARWRFRPATVDGRAIESRKTMTVFFRIPD